MHYIPLTHEDEKAMLEKIGVGSFDELLDAIIPRDLRCSGPLGLPKPASEHEIRKIIKDLGQRNVTADDCVSFLGGGIYDHYIPAVINQILLRSEFYTAYTPYQAEVSQGTLQAIFEFQTAVCELTKMEVANASMYDGASALAEACLMAKTISKRNRVVIAETVNPQHRAVVQTYVTGTDTPLAVVKSSGGMLDLDALESAVDENTACVAIQHPNFFGLMEEVGHIEKVAHRKGALFISSFDPISLGMLVPPGDYGADIAVGEGQGLGLPMGFGGPLLGLFAAKKEHVRFMPGRLVGMTKDRDGKRGFVLTLQTREQHIRREKATSNICTNEALCALGALIYLSLMGREGVAEVAQQCFLKSHYLNGRLGQLARVKLPFDRPFFKEFVIEVDNPEQIVDRLIDKRIFGGIDLGRFDECWKNYLLVAVTEKRTREEMDYFVDTLKTIL